jgi:hypothetical protein
MNAIPLIEMDGEKINQRLADGRELKVISHRNPELITLAVPGFKIVVNACKLQSAIESAVRRSSARQISHDNS